MAKKNVRNMKVCGQSGYKYETVPAITLKGKWLEELGFHLGDYVQVKCENGQLIITPDVNKAQEQEANLLQRSFAELLPSEKAAVLVARYEKISSQGKRNDIRQEIEALEETCGHDVHKSRKRTCGHDVHKSQKSRDGLGEEYGMTGRNIARYMRLDRLIPEFKDAVDKGTLAMVAAVDLSYLNVKMQKLIQQVAEAEGKKLKPKQAVELRKMGKEITKEGIESVLAGKEQKKPQSVSVKLPVELYERYFGQMDAGAVQEIMEKALEGYFGKEAGVSTRLPRTLCTPSASQ